MVLGLNETGFGTDTGTEAGVAKAVGFVHSGGWIGTHLPVLSHCDPLSQHGLDALQVDP